MNRSKEIFGEDANEFNPERWLGDEKKARYMESGLATVHRTYDEQANGSLDWVHVFALEEISRLWK